ncbi:bifunctional hydroxymethylpyrimidine kinase/phosphomethylpyrimidine kinase [Brochothrix thermosphacta]|uniref:bifunctional hydroxymethylpyrimidine kinase/phosphomethylpyrimidine kinase n=1 Tax=Brochothrix thermosphacta TaxID=2756 RepID=UPI0039AF5743
MSIKKTLTIAGSDSSGGAGLQADLKTFQEYGTFGFSAVTSIVTMDPDNNWSHGVTIIDSEVVRAALKTVLSGGPVDAMKTGMLGSVENTKAAADAIEQHQLKNVVIDPVMVCKGEDELMQPENAAAIRDLLVPLATVVTPNLFEASQLAQTAPITDLEGMKVAAAKIHALGANYVVIKGGKALQTDKAIDLLFDGSNYTVLEAPKVPGNHNHGAGCTFAAAITAGLANGMTVSESVAKAKDFVTAAIKDGFALNQFIGPVWHGAYNRQKS